MPILDTAGYPTCLRSLRPRLGYRSRWLESAAPIDAIRIRQFASRWYSAAEACGAQVTSGSFNNWSRTAFPSDIIVGSSAGAIVAAFYAAVGLTLDELVRDSREFRGRHLVAHSLNVRLGHRLDWVLGRASGLIPRRLEQLERATFVRLPYGVRKIGVVCHDLTTGQPRYFSTGCDRGVCVSDVVRASASIPFLFPSIPVQCGEECLLLADGGISDCLPIAFARRPPLSATHLIVSDCRWLATAAPESSEHLIYVRPRLVTTGTFWAPSSSLLAAVRHAASAEEIVDCARRWRGGFAAGNSELTADLVR